MSTQTYPPRSQSVMGKSIHPHSIEDNAETKDFARPTSHSVQGWTGKNKDFCSPGTQHGRHVIKVYGIC